MRDIGSVEQVCDRLGILLDTIPLRIRECRVSVNPRLKSCFGKARWRGNRSWIELNQALFNDEAELKDTVAHEVAHLIAGRGEGHGPLWEKLAITLGSTGNRLATREAAKRIGVERVTKLVAVCEKCGHEVRRVQRLPRNKTFTHSKPCGGDIRPV